MKPLLERCNQFLDQPLALVPRALLIVAAFFAGLAAAILAAPAAPRAAPFVLGVFALLLIRAAVHGKMASLVDVTVLGAYLAIWVVWTALATTFAPGPALWPLVASAAFLGAALASAWRDARAEAARDLRTAD